MKPEPTPASPRQQPSRPEPAALDLEQGAERAGPDRLRGLLSALADGQPQALDEACTRWRDDPEARRTWHTYQLIGDVMRSEELASSPSRDAAFLASFRARLAAEPVVLAPEPLPAVQPALARERRQGWAVPAAVAAGFVLVAGVLVVTRVDVVDAGAARSPGLLVQAPQPVAVLRAADPAGPAQAPMLHNPALAEYLRAHHAARMGVAVEAPGGALRRVDIAVPAGPRQ